MPSATSASFAVVASTAASSAWNAASSSSPPAIETRTAGRLWGPRPTPARTRAPGVRSGRRSRPRWPFEALCACSSFDEHRKPKNDCLAVCGGCELARHIEARELGTLTTLPTMSFATSPSWTCVRATPNALNSARVPAPAPARRAAARDRKRGPVGTDSPWWLAPTATRLEAAVRNAATTISSPLRADINAWATDLATIFGWDDVWRRPGCRRRPPRLRSAAAAPPPPHARPRGPELLRVLSPSLALDSANIAWSLGTSIARGSSVASSR